MMDDYLDPNHSQPTLVPADAHFSCRRFAEHEIRRVINHDLAAPKQIGRESVWFPDPADPTNYDKRITNAGGVDMFIVASGASDGHVAFCGPGADIDAKTSIVRLAESTRRDNTTTFPQFHSIDDVPTHGVTVGLGTIRHLSRSVLMILHGADKRESAQRIDASTTHDPLWPATFIHACRNARVWMDTAADPAVPATSSRNEQ